MSDYVLEMHNIDKRFGGTHALKDVTIQFKRAEVNVIMGENGAGKSTLMRILTGAHGKDSGKLIYEGKEVEIHTPADAKALGISMIYQELNLVPDMSVAENLFVGNEQVKGLFVDKKEQIRIGNEVMANIGVDIDCSMLVSQLSLAKQQMVEIAKSVLYEAKVVIMDEPTSSLTEIEVNQLFKVIADMKKKGVTIIYISHRMDEIFKIGDNISVMRDGEYVGQWPIDETDEQSLIKNMVGRTITNMFPKEEVPIGDVVLEVKNLTRKGEFRDVSFSVRRGEILGFSGLVGAGRTELAKAIYGVTRPDSGEIWLNGKKMKFAIPKNALDAKIAYVPEDRKQYGLNLIGSIKDNIAVTSWDKLSKGSLIDSKAEKELSLRMIEKLGIKVASEKHPGSSLSGGNQQKVVLAKFLSQDLDVLILDEPTRGVDVGAKSEIHKLVVEAARSGVAVIMISSELPEILGMSDRIIIMHEGDVTGEVNGQEASQELVMAYAHKTKLA
ncbi:ribose import ATP-binding protein RbsA [Christensenellaceae bacterium]|nr:ribose import ATP-binding protein RbsA [Christensenellaceae bacterium]BDF60635.1 ribose import ATP-binding protein RbsA [Christensenellaceae bacterium]